MRTRVGEESFDPALTDTSGYHRMIQKLGDLQKQGAVFVGHNLGFDWDAIENTHRSLYGDLPMADFDIKAARANTRDTLEHARTIGDTHFDPEKGRDSQTLENLCRKHGIPAGNHAALGDADASVKLYLKQVGLTNRVPKTATRANTVGEISGIDYSKISPWCGKDKGICSGCREIDSRKAENIDKDGKVIDKQRHKIIKNLEKLHKG
jgi:DNA polymerase III epsilon subunit-like protein